MESFLTKEHQITPKTQAFGRGVLHAGLVFLIGSMISFPVSLWFWYASDIATFAFLLTVFFIALLVATYVMKKDLLKEQTHTAITASTTCFVVAVLVLCMDAFVVDVLGGGVGNIGSTLLFMMSLAVFPALNYTWLKYYLNRTQNKSRYQVTEQ